MDQEVLEDLAARLRGDGCAALEAAYRHGLMSAPLPMVLTDRGGRVAAVNAQAEALLARTEADLYGMSVLDLCHPDDRAEVQEVVARLHADQAWRADYEARWVRPDGSVVWTRRHVFSVPEQGYAVALLEDLTQERLLQRMGATLLETASLLAKGGSLAEVAQLLARLAEDRWSDVGCSLTLVDDTGSVLVPVVHGRLPDEYAAALGEIPAGLDGAVCGGAFVTGERTVILDLPEDPRAARFRTVLERFGVVSGWSVPVVDPLGRRIGAFGLFHPRRAEPTARDWEVLETLAQVAGTAAYVDRERQARARREHETRVDALSGLPNMVALLEAVRQAAPPVSLAVVRLDNLGAMTAALGEHTGARVLERLGARAASAGEVVLTALVAPSTLAVVVSGTWRLREAEQLRAVMSRSLRLGALTVRPEVRVGLAVADSVDELAPETLLQRATLALPAAGAAVYEPTLAARQLSLYALSAEVHAALRADQVVVHYQPKHDLRTGRVSGAEALARWQHPERGLLMPGTWLPAVELAGAGPDLALHVLRRVVRDLPELRACGLLGRIAINLTAEDVRSQHLVDVLCDPGTALWQDVDVELTESALVDADARCGLDRLAAAGFDVGLDDFGTGWSSLSVLHTLPLSTVKIDRSFVQRLVDDPAAEALVRGVIEVCGHLGISVVAEGVETEEQAARALLLGCETGQGYLFAQPAPLDALSLRTAEPVDVVLAPEEPVERTVSAQELAREAALRGQSRHTIAAALNARGLRTDSGRRWNASTVMRLLADD